MSRKITCVAVFAIALTFAVDSQAFAKGGKGGGKGGSRGGRQTAHHNHNRGHNHRGGRLEHTHRGGWGYEYASYPVVVAEAPVVDASVVDDDSVVEAAPLVDTYESYYFGGHRGHGSRHHHGRNGGRHGGKGGHGGHVGHGKK